MSGVLKLDHLYHLYLYEANVTARTERSSATVPAEFSCPESSAATLSILAATPVRFLLQLNRPPFLPSRGAWPAFGGAEGVARIAFGAHILKLKLLQPSRYGALRRAEETYGRRAATMQRSLRVLTASAGPVSRS